MELIDISRKLCTKVDTLSFPEPVAFVYNPLRYARVAHESYLERYGQSPKKALLLGMNPGPWGMVQTGVPFGEVNVVRDWLGINVPVKRPSNEHPKRPVTGFDCTRSEVSGRRLWGWAKDRFKTPSRFFETFFVYNYCPLAFLEESGRNFTPDKLAAKDKEKLFQACDKALKDSVHSLNCEYVIGVGSFAEQCAKRVLASTPVKTGRILHPSPASPAANRGWAERAEAQLKYIDKLLYP
ncbi:MAG: single-stranded DNA-binding protein [Myxococcales bacterium]|nr:MAG: single-stranded DNA-binding protein [Myxococcales bacterium]